MAASTPKPETPGWRHLARPVWAEGDACAAPGLSACDGQFRIRTIALTCPSELRARFYGSTRWRPRFWFEFARCSAPRGKRQNPALYATGRHQAAIVRPPARFFDGDVRARRSAVPSHGRG